MRTALPLFIKYYNSFFCVYKKNIIGKPVNYTWLSLVEKSLFGLDQKKVLNHRQQERNLIMFFIST